jgi:hypothetical protein
MRLTPVCIAAVVSVYICICVYVGVYVGGLCVAHACVLQCASLCVYVGELCEAHAWRGGKTVGERGC